MSRGVFQPGRGRYMDDERYRTKRGGLVSAGAAALDYQLSTIDCKLSRKLPHPNRQTLRIELSLTHRKQTTATRSNRQISGLSARPLLPSASHDPTGIVILLALSASCEGSVFREGRIASSCSVSAAAIEYGALQFEAKLRARRIT